MQKGTALKWAQRVRSFEGSIGTGQLRFEEDFDCLGILCDFLDPNGWTPSYIGLSWHGEMFKLPEEWRRKIKMKSEYGSFTAANGYSTDICSVWSLGKEYTAFCIETYYAQL